MKRTWIKKRFILLTVSIISVWLAYLISQSSEAYELGLKANKYVELNLNKNWGIRKKALEFSTLLLSYYPHPEYVKYGKPDKEVGIESRYSPKLSSITAYSNIIAINTTKQLIGAFRKAKAGDVILLSAGTYHMQGKRFKLKNSGTAERPILLMAESFGEVILKMDSLEGLYLDQANWSISNLIFEGVCKSHSKCEHAIHLSGDADNVEISHNRFINFNAHIKSNGKNYYFPDHVRISGNDFYNNSARNTTNSVTPIDVVGGDDWVIENNFIADFALKKQGKFTVAYGAFLKGGGKRGKFVNNVVNCAWKLPHQSYLDIRIGLSLGGGGTNGKFCPEKKCDFEHSQGIIENNLILNCRNDVGIYLNKAQDSLVKQNTLLNTLGIDARFSASTVMIEDNQFHGRIKTRNGARISATNNTSLGLHQQASL